MLTLNSRRAKTLLLSGSLFLSSNLAGCGSGNTNEREFLDSAPAGAPADHPNETYAERRERTRSRTKAELAAGAKKAAAPAKDAAGAKAP